MPAEMPGKNCLLYRCKNKDEFAASMPFFDEWGMRPIGLVGPRENPVGVVPFLAAGAELAPGEGAGGRAPTGAGGSSAEEHMPSGDPGASSSGACDPPPEALVVEETRHAAPEAEALRASGGCSERAQGCSPRSGSLKPSLLVLLRLCRAPAVTSSALVVFVWTLRSSASRRGPPAAATSSDR